jgi:hypothetical protein
MMKKWLVGAMIGLAIMVAAVASERPVHHYKHGPAVAAVALAPADMYFGPQDMY